MYNIHTLNKISSAGIKHFDANTYNCKADIDSADAIMVRSAAMHDLTLSANLKAIARAGAGVNNIPIDKCTENGIVVFNTPGANANAVKELVLLALLMSSRKIAPAIDWVKTLKGQDAVPKLVEGGKSAFVGPEIMGKTLGVVGLGAIGVLVANAAHNLGMNVLGYDPYISINAAWDLTKDIKQANSLKEIYEKCDYITLHVPFNKDTKGMINTEAISIMKDNVRILNFSRGELVDTNDMLNALNDKKVYMYITDFPNDELLCLDNVLAIPHLGASTPESEDNCASMAAVELISFLEDGNVKNSVNLPECVLPRSSDFRVCVIHKNINGMVNNISQCLSNYNIENMLSKSRGDYAYTILDLNAQIDDNVTNNIKSIDGVIRVETH